MSLFLSVWNLGVYTTQFYLTWDDQNQLIKQTKKETSKKECIVYIYYVYINTHTDSIYLYFIVNIQFIYT